eukprot:5704877-Amphidinium_carterae.1
MSMELASQLRALPVGNASIHWACTRARDTLARHPLRSSIGWQKTAPLDWRKRQVKLLAWSEQGALP